MFEGLLLADHDLLVDATVALDAADAAVHVHGVVEVHVVGHLVHLDPADRFAGLHALLDERQRGAVGLHLAVAVPARVGRRDVRVAGLLDEVVAVATIETEDGVRTGVEGVVEGDRLIRSVSDVQILVRGVLVDGGDHDHAGDEEATRTWNGAALIAREKKLPRGAGRLRYSRSLRIAFRRRDWRVF
jgi:hypothetical protein